jgi:FkbM family methyltransferase
MLRIFSIIFSYFIIVDNLLEKITNISIVRFIYSQYLVNCYFELLLLKKKTLFFCPTKETKLRTNTFLKKEPGTIRWVNNFIGKNIIFWDIGSNIGLYSIYAAIKHKDINIICFEPSLSNLRILSRDIYVNKLSKKISICQLPIIKNNYQFTYFTESQFIDGSALNYTSNSFSFTKHKYNNTYQVLGSSLNNFSKINKFKFPNYIKIDVDGLEHLIIAGATKILRSRKVKEIMIETNMYNQKKKKFIFSQLTKNKFFLVNKYNSDVNNPNCRDYNFLFKKN